jgi:peptidyl-prolyl cis-trans isomerase D
MFDFIRKYAQGWFAWAIIILVAVPFALWGIHQYSEGDSSVNVAVVNGKKISDQEYQQAYQQQRNRIQTMLGKNFDPSLIDEKQLRKSVLENLIEREVIIQGALDAGLRVSDARIGTEIRAIPNLQNKGQFDKEQYERLLRSQGLSVGAFEHMVGNDLVIQQMNQGIADSAIVTKAELDALLRIKLQQRDIGYALVPASSYAGDVVVEDKAVEQFYQDNPDRFRSPEQVSVNYIELSVDDLAKDIQITESALHERYQERAADFTTPEERRARHILIQVASDASPAVVDAAEKKAEGLLARIRKGESFAELAKQFSDDPGSAKEGGDLGFFGRGVMDKAFEQAAYSLKVGEVSEPVRSTFGIHLIKLEAVRGGERKPFEQVRAELESDLKHQQAEDRYFAEAETLSNMAFEHADNLTAAAQALRLPIQSSPLFTRNGGVGIAANPKVRDAAFSDDMLLSGKNSEAIELDQDHVVVLHLKEHRPASLRPLDDVRMDIRQVLRMEAAKNKTKEVGEGIVKRLKAGEDPNMVMLQMKLKWVRPGFLGRQDPKADRQIIEDAFYLDRPQGELKPVFGGKAMKSGDFAVYGVYAVKDGDPTGANQKDVDSLKDSLTRERGQMIFKEYVDALKDTMKITRHEEKL